jgi:hypothetical protein
MKLIECVLCTPYDDMQIATQLLALTVSHTANSHTHTRSRLICDDKGQGTMSTVLFLAHGNKVTSLYLNNSQY